MGARKRIKTTLDIFEPGPSYYVDYHGFGGYLGFADYETNSEGGFFDYGAETRPYISPGVSGVEDDDDSIDPDNIPDWLPELCYNLNFAAAGAITYDDAVADNFPSLRVVPSPVNCCILLPGFAGCAHHIDKHPGITNRSIVPHGIDTSTDPYTRINFIDVDLNYFYPVGAYQDYWTDGFNGTYFTWKNMPRIYNKASDNPWLPRGLVSIFKLPSDPIFAFALWTTEDSALGYETRVIFGTDYERGGTFSYVIPNGSGKTQMFYHPNASNLSDSVKLRRVGGSDSGSAGGSMSETIAGSPWVATTEMSAQVVYIGFFGPYIAVSGDGFSTISDVYYRTVGEPSDGASMGQYLPCGPSPVTILYTGGQFAFAWLPLFTPEIGEIYSPVHKLPFPIEDMEDAGASETRFREWITAPSTSRNDYGIYQVESGMVRSEKCGAPYVGAPSNSRCEDGYGFDFSTQIRRRTYRSVIVKADGGGTGGDGAEYDFYCYPPGGVDPWIGLNAVRAFDRYSTVGNGGVVGRYYHDQGACLFRVDYSKDNILSRKSSRSYTQYNPNSFSYDISHDGNSAEVAVDDVSTDGGDFSNTPFSAMHDGVNSREVHLTNQWYDGDGAIAETLNSTISFGGYMAEPQTVIENGKVLTSIQMRDFQSAGLDVVVDGKLPVFDGWPVYDAVNWLLGYMGIGPEQRTFRTRAFDGSSWSWVTADSIEDTGMYLNIGPSDKPFWVAEEGRPIMDLIAEMCIYDYGAAIICQNGLIAKCCPHCMTLRNGAIGTINNAIQHTLGGPYSPGCYESDTALSANSDGIFHYFTTAEGDSTFKTYVPDESYLPLKHEITKIETQPFDLSSYYNSVKVKGKSFVYDGEPRDVELSDWASIRGDAVVSPTGYSLGRKKTLELSYEWANSDAVRERVARMNFYNVSQWTKSITITVPYDPNYSIGDPFAVFGPIAEHAKARNRVFRVTSIGHSNEASRVATSTTLRGRFIWEIA